ncbi:MAG: D-amino peptidase [Kribbellaceae bacterium]|nr:D-amino peptidase [Kribbellaceae bacterium]
MKVFLSTDMEGTAGVVDWSQCRGPSQEYEYYRGQLQAAVNAAIDGALGAGATESWSTTHTRRCRTFARTSFTAARATCPSGTSRCT